MVNPLPHLKVLEPQMLVGVKAEAKLAASVLLVSVLLVSALPVNVSAAAVRAADSAVLEPGAALAGDHQGDHPVAGACLFITPCALPTL